VRFFILFLALTSPAIAGNGQSRFAVAASDSLTTATSCEILTALSGTDTKSKQVPDGAFLGRLDLTLTSIVTAATVTVWLAKSSTGEDAITDQVAATIVDDDADGNGSVSVLVGSGWVDDSTAGTQPYVCGKTDAGTATSIGRLIFEVR